MTDIGELVKKRMTELGWSQSELSRQSGVSQQVINYLVKGHHIKSPRMDNTLKLIKALGLDASVLFK